MASDAIAIGAHPDDAELMALPEISAARGGHCRVRAIVCCDGAGTPLVPGADPTAIVARRQAEAKTAAAIGEFALTLLGHSSEFVRGDGWPTLVAELREHLCRTPRARLITHTPTDRHPTHVAVCAAAVAAARGLGPEHRPTELLGCEVWGGLDWLGPEAVVRDVSGLDALASALLGAHESQLERTPYDAGFVGRARANAVFRDPHRPGGPTAIALAMNLTPCLATGGPSLRALAVDAISRHRARVGDALAPYPDDA